MLLIAICFGATFCGDGISSSPDDDEQDDDNDNNNDNNDNNDNDSIIDDDASPDEFGIIWVNIPGGEYIMGCSENDNMCSFDEYPSHHVRVDSFQMSNTEITQKQYEDITGVTPTCYYYEEKYPAVEMLWEDAKDYCETVGGRLPTEAEWEYAARAGTTTPWYCGEDVQCLFNIAWFDWNFEGDEYSFSDVGMKKPNAFHLYDMLGNAAEYVSDWYDEKYYSESPIENPQGPDNGMDSSKVVRGGSVDFAPKDVRASSRAPWWVDSPACNTGFRCAKDTE